MKITKLFAILTALTSFGFTVTTEATIISQWTFEAHPPADLDNSTTIAGISADSGNGTASGVHASSSSDWSTPAGNGSANSLSVNNWAVSDYFLFQLSTAGFENISVTWDQTGSGTGPRDFVLQYSTDGNLFTQIGSSYVVSVSTWVAGTFHSGFDITPNLTGIAPSIADQAILVFRLVDNSTTSINPGTVGTSGSGRVDNFTVTGTAITTIRSVPDSLPFGFAACTLLGVAILGHSQRQKSATS